MEISKEIAIWDGSFKYAGKGGVGAGVVKRGEGFVILFIIFSILVK